MIIMGKALLLKALKGEVTERPAWVPFVGVHGAKLIDVPAKDYLRDSNLIVSGLTKAIELYQPDGIPIAFDLQLEAEILGCKLVWADDTPPSVSTHPLSAEESKTLKDLPAFDISAGRFPLVLDAVRRIRRNVGDDIALYGLICGPFTLALHLLGNDIFLQMFDEPEYVQEVLDYCAEVGRTAAMAYREAGCDVIAIVDPMTSQISPSHFKEFVMKPVNAIFDTVRASGGYSSFFVCGDATRNLELMCQTNCDNLSVDENISLANLRDMARANGKSFGGNLKLTTVLLMGTPAQSRKHAVECFDIGGTQGYVLAPGCDLPYNVPAENLTAVAEIVHDEYKREVARTMQPEESADTFDDIVLPDYSSTPGVTVDVITLDSEACAPCQYMVAAAQKAAAMIDGTVVVREHKIKSREGVGMMCKLGVQNLPTICIDGVQAFVSIIPDIDTLRDRIAERLAKKR